MKRHPGSTAHSCSSNPKCCHVLSDILPNLRKKTFFKILPIIDRNVLLEMFERIAFRVQSYKLSYRQTVGLIFELPNDLCVLIVFQVFSDRIGEVNVCVVSSIHWYILSCWIWYTNVSVSLYIRLY